MESMNDKMFIRQYICYEFHQQKSVAQVLTSICFVLGDEVLSKSMSHFWFHRFRPGNFDVNEALLHTNSAQTQQKLAKPLGLCQ